jgi:hypothetical protein
MSLGVTVQTRTASPPKGISVDTGTAFLACKPATGSTSAATLVHSVADYEAAYGLRSVSANAPAYDWLDTFFREGGQRCYVARYSSSPPLSSALALFGAELGPGQVAAPEETPGATTDATLLAHCQANNRVALLDVNNGDSVSAMNALGDLIPTLNMDYGACFGPWVTVPPPAGVVGGSARQVPASAVIAALVARVDKNGNPNRAAAGRDYPLQYATGFVTNLTKQNLSDMLDHGVNGAGTIFGVLENYGFQTAVDQSADNPYWQFNCSRTRMYIAARAASLAEPFVFRPIDGRGRLQAALKGTLEGMLLTLYQADGLFGETPAEAFAVTVGSSVNTTTTIAQGELHAVAEVRYSIHAKAVIVELVTVPTNQNLTAE